MARRIEAEPVKHAHWIDQKHGVYKCSNCGNYLDFGGATGAVAYAWFIWEKGYNGETIVKWFN